VTKGRKFCADALQPLQANFSDKRATCLKDLEHGRNLLAILTGGFSASPIAPIRQKASISRFWVAEGLPNSTKPN
jgi:hypothetical protein